MEVKRPSPVPNQPHVPAPASLRMIEPSPTTFPQLLQQRLSRLGERVFLPRRQSQDPSPITFARLAQDLDRLASALLDIGIERGDRIGLIAENRYEWLLIDQALVGIGAVDVPRGVDTTPAELQFILQHSGCSAAFADDDRIARELLAMQQDLPQLKHVIVMADKSDVPGATALGELLERGGKSLSNNRAEIDRRRAEVKPDDLLTIVYTSGTTAEPKGVMLTHDNMLSNVRVVTDVLRVDEHDVFLSVLPAWHAYERIMDYLALAAGSQLVYTDRRRIKQDLTEIKPTVFAAVPRIWEMLHDGVVNHSRKLTGLSGSLLRRSLELSRLVGSGRAGLAGRMQHALLDRLVLRKVREQFGGRLRLCVSGGGALPRHIDETLLGMGLPMRNGYGLTETSPVACIRLLNQRDPGHIGPPLPHTAIEARRADGSTCPVGETGVLWIRGPQVMRGYYENPNRTAEVLTDDGWFNSGDLGHRDANGNVWITGRAKDTIVLAGGENVEPEPVETLIKTSPFVEQAVIVGQDQKNLGVLLVPMREALEQEVPAGEWDDRDGVLHDQRVQAIYRRELDRLLTRDNGCRNVERVGSLIVLSEPMTTDNGLLTHTMKVRRHVVADRYGDLIDAMFKRG